MPSNRLLQALALCASLMGIVVSTPAAPLKVSGRFLQDAHGNNIQMRGVNLPVYKSGYVDDLDVVAAAIAQTKTNAVRIEWWANPVGGQTEYTVANLDRAIQKFYDLGIIPVVELHDLTFQYGHDAKTGPGSDGNDRTIFANTITAYWTRSDVRAILVKHQDHLVVNLANEWGSTLYSDGTPTTSNFIQNYTDTIKAMRNAGIVAPLMVDAPKGFEYQFLIDHGAALLAADPQHNTMLSAHAYWAATAFTDANLDAIVDAFTSSALPIVLGEASSNAYTDIPCDPIHYARLLGRANSNAIGYLFWAWYEDGQCGQQMNITVGSNGVTLPTAANPGFGNDALHDPAWGIDAAQPPTVKADFSPVFAAAFPLTVAKAGNGSGAVASLPAGIDCGGTCSAAFDFGMGVTLTATPNFGSRFVGWSGDCTGADTCQVTMSAARSVTAIFQLKARLSNISTRMQVLNGNDVMIAGFIVGGSVPKTVVVNVAGPNLRNFGITNVLANPKLTLVRSSDQSIVKANDDWQAQANPSDVAALTSSGFQPNDPLEPAIIATLLPGAYTAIVEGVGGTTGVALAGVFEVDAPDAPLVNISTRGEVLLGNDVMIAGFIIHGSDAKTVVINVAGPNLANFGIANALANPTLTVVRSSDSSIIAANDDWQAQAIPADVAAIQATGFQPNNALEPALILTLQPGAYTAIVQGAGGTTGVGLVGVFAVP